MLLVHESGEYVDEDASESIVDGVAVWRVVASHRRNDLWNDADQNRRYHGVFEEEE